MTPESTEPRTAARDVIFSALDGARVVPPDDLDTATDAVLAVLATIAPTEPGRVEISHETAQTCADLIEVQRRFLGGRRVVPVLEHAHTDLTNGLRAAAERAAAGGA
jgi:hypothetical protein